MTRTHAPAFEVTPLSECRNATDLQRAYPEGPGRDRRMVVDMRLLVMLEEESRQRTRFGHQPPTVAELGEVTVQGIVDEVTKREFPNWRLGGDAESIIERLDKHFADVQAEWLRLRLEREKSIARRRAAQAAQPPGWPFDPAANGQRDAAIWGLTAA